MNQGTKKVRKISVQAKTRNIVFSTAFWRTYLLPSAVLFILSLGLYLQTIKYDYVLDDLIVITENNFTKAGFSGLKDIFMTESFVGYFGEQKDLVEGNRYRPLSIATFAIEHQFLKLNPAVSHFINVLLYALSVVLLYRLFLVLIPPMKNSKWFTSVAFLGALFYLFHPVHIEAVANIKGRDEILSMLFSVLALFYSMKYAIKGGRGALIGSGFLFLIGMLAKENTITFIAIIPLSIYFFTKASFRKIGLALAPILIATVLYLLFRVNVIGHLFSNKEIVDLLNNPFYGMDGGEKYATIFYTLIVYLRLLFFPHPLTHDYYPYHIPKMEWADIMPIVSLILYIVLIFLALRGLKGKKMYSYAIIFYIATLSIASNIVFNIGTFMNERFLVVPSIALCLWLAHFLARWLPQKLKLEKEGVNYWTLGISALFIIFFAFKDIQRIPAWRNALTLNTDSVKVSKNSTRANCFMATALFKEYQNENDVERKKELLNEADGYLEQSLKVHPIYKNALQMKSGVLSEQYKMNRDVTKLLDGFYEILKIRDIDFIDTFLEYLNERSGNEAQLANFYYKTGFEFFATTSKQYNKAEKYLLYGIKVAPRDQKIRTALCSVYTSTGNTQKAAQYCN